MINLVSGGNNGGGIVPPTNIAIDLDGRDYSATWDAVANALSYQYRIDGGSWIDVATNAASGVLEDYGNHTFETRAVMPSNPALNGFEAPAPAGIVFNELQHISKLSSAGTTHSIALVQPIVAGSLLVILMQYEGVPAEIASINVGGTALPIIALQGANPEGIGHSGAYVFPSTATAGPVVITISASAACNIMLWEVECVGGTPELDFAACSYARTGAAPHGPATTNSSGNVAIFLSALSLFPATLTAVSAPYVLQAFAANAASWASAYNRASAPTPAWTNSDAGAPTSFTAIGFGVDPEPFLNQGVCTFEGGVDGADVTEAALQASTFGYKGARWTVHGPGAPLKFRSTGAMPLKNATGRLPDGSKLAAGTGNLCVEFDTDEVASYLKLDLAPNIGTSPFTAFSADIRFWCNIDPNDTCNLDIFSIIGSSGVDFCNAKYVSNPAPDGVHRVIQCEVGGGGGNSNILVPTSTDLLFRLKYTRAATMKIRIYDFSGPGGAENLLGTINEFSSNTANAAYIVFGQHNLGSTPQAGKLMRFGSLKWDLTGADMVS